MVFKMCDTVCSKNMSDWIKDSYQENDNSLSFLTVVEKEHMYTRNERRKALQAGEFVMNAGFPSKVEAIKMIRDGNIENIPHSVQDIKAFYDIYGPLPSVIRGKTIDKLARTTNQIDEGTKEQRKVQFSPMTLCML